MDAETFTPVTPQEPGDRPYLSGDSPELARDEIPCLDDIVTEDDTPVDNIYSALQQKLLTEPLYSSWAGPGEGRKFLALAKVGLFYAVAKPPLVPEVLLSLDVEAATDARPKQNRSYFIWVFGKPPETVIEVISNREGEEDTRKFRHYAQLGILYYVIWDPLLQLSEEPLRIFTLSEKRYVPLAGGFLPIVGLGLAPWNGSFENMPGTWLRWCDASGTVVPTGEERAEQERQHPSQTGDREGQTIGRPIAIARSRTAERGIRRRKRSRERSRLLAGLTYRR